MFRPARYFSCFCICRLNLFRVFRNIFIFACLSSLFIQYSYINYFQSEHIPSSITTRLFPDMPLTINLRAYPVCHPKELYLENITLQYHYKYPDKQNQTCFLVEYLDGGPWQSYITHEFVEILVHLKELGIKSNITYRSLPFKIDLHYKTNLTKYFLNACGIDENLPKEKQTPIVVLFWDINRILWYLVRQKLDDLLKSTRLYFMIYIDDLHYTTKGIFNGRQYLFQHIASEIFSAYPYLFHNYYNDIPTTKITWLPHAASTLSYRSINTSAENVLFVSGANLIDWYPCRARAFELCETQKNLTACLQHPGYGETMKNDSSYHYGGERYFSYMRKYVFGLATCESVHYAIAKLFELPANGLALVTTDDLSNILEALNLYPDEHFLTVDCSSSERLTNELIRIQNLSKEEIFRIRKKSQQIIFQQHLTKHRAELLHVRILAQALIASSTSAIERRQWEQWGRNCY
jgi:hypothetical protein